MCYKEVFLVFVIQYQRLLENVKQYKLKIKFQKYI